jgi:hypothetical protein
MKSFSRLLALQGEESQSQRRRRRQQFTSRVHVFDASQVRMIFLVPSAVGA